jgi:AcrR family transcriptional regulator
VASEKRERTRRRLIDAAAHVVAERGFHGASVDLIAAKAGLSIGALYSSFNSKDDVLFAVFENHLRWFDESLQQTTEAPDVTKALADWVGAISREPEQFLIFVEFWAYAVRRPKLRRQLAGHLRAMRKAVAEGLAQRADELSAPPSSSPEFGALIALSLARGMAFEQLADPETVNDQLVAGLLTGLLGDRSPKRR